jgi:hypothetical protein
VPLTVQSMTVGSQCNFMLGGVTWRPARASSGSPAPVVHPRADARAASTCVAVNGLHRHDPTHAQQKVQCHPALLDDNLLVSQHSWLLVLHADENRQAALVRYYTSILHNYNQA